MRRVQLQLALVAATGVLCLGACNSFKPFHSANDQTITTDIQAKLFNDPILKLRDIHVDSHQGTVTVSGTVHTDLEKAAVARFASEEEGVKNVVDLLRVDSTVASQPTAAAENGLPSAPVAKPAPVAAPATPKEEAAPAKSRHTHHAYPVANSDSNSNAASELQAYTNSVAPQTPESPAPNPASSPAPPPTSAPVAAPAPVPAAPATPASVAPATPPPAPAPKPQEHLTVPAGSVLTIRMIDGVDSSRNQPGEEFAASLDAPVVVDDRVAVSRGADARVRLVTAQTSGHIAGQSELQLELISLTVNGVSYPTESGYYQQHGNSRGTRSAEAIGGGAVLGALLGGLLGRGRGAAIGSIAGAGAGTAVQVSTRGQQVKVPAETKIDFTLRDPLSIPVGGSQ